MHFASIVTHDMGEGFVNLFSKPPRVVSITMWGNIQVNYTCAAIGLVTAFLARFLVPLLGLS